MSTTQAPGARIESAVTEWPGVVAGPHRFGGREYQIGRREFGHTHGDAQVDVPFSMPLRDVLVREGWTAEHHLYPDSGWVTFYLGRDGEAEEAIALLRLSYLRHVAELQNRRDPDPDPELVDVDVAAELAALEFGPRVESVFERLLQRPPRTD